MISKIREQYNREFTPKKYAAFLQELNDAYPGQLDFRVAETPIYVRRDFVQKMLDTCEHIVDVVLQDDYKRKTDAALLPQHRVPGEDTHPHCIAFDFGICEGEDGGLEPQLIELQGFPSLFAYQILMPEVHKKHFLTPEGFSPYLNGFDTDSYTDLLRRIILGGHAPENVILLEIFPEKQKTRVDFAATKEFVGIDAVCITKLIQEGRQLYYDRGGVKTPIHRIYNRLIFDDLEQQSPEVQEKGKILQQDLNVEWVPHPSWFYRISKFTLPFLDHPYVPQTRFLSEVPELPTDLENYVVKPLFSFAGQGVIIDVTEADIRKIEDPQNWILQRKVKYAAAVATPDEPAKGEIRLFYLWEEGADRPVATTNLSRLSKGKMVGVRYNKDRDWVGGSYCLFEL